jgi:hypothetical protein
MRLYSTPESAHKGEVTKLAIVETFLAVAVYVWICTVQGSWRSLATIVLIAPLMLFRTAAASALGMVWYKRWFDTFDDSSGGTVLAQYVVTPLVGIGIRVISTIVAVLKDPIAALRQAPDNWVRQTLCVDFVHPPEIVPGEASDPEGDDIPKFADVAEAVVSPYESAFSRSVVVTFSIPFLLIGWIPAFAYRLSFKATAFVYGPFIWIADATAGSRLPLAKRLEAIKDGQLESVRRGFSWLVFGLLATKAAFLWGLVSVASLRAKFETARAIRLLDLDGWPWWQILAGTDAILTFGLLFFADGAIRRADTPQAWSEEAVRNTISFTTFVRATLALIAIAHFFTVVLRVLVPDFTLPWLV